MGKGRRLRASRRSHVVRLLLRTAGGHRSVADALLTSSIGGVVEQCTDVVYKEWVQQLSDVLLVREIQRAVKGYPVIID